MSTLFYFQIHGRTGGVKMAYRHVDVLRAHGYRAVIVHPGPRPEAWFESDAPVIGEAELRRAIDPERDFVVVPEVLSYEELDALPGRKVIFHQSLYHAFQSLEMNGGRRDPCLHPDVRALLTVSAHGARSLRFCYGPLPVHRVENGLDAARFPYRRAADKKRIIAYVRKGEADSSYLKQLFHTLRARADRGLSALGEFTWVEVRDRSELEVSALLGDALFFAFLNVAEGSPLLPREAMLCGCLVVGFGAGPLADWFDPGLRFAYGDVVGVARRIERLARCFPRNAAALDRITTRSRAAAMAASEAREARSVLRAWRSILERRAAPPGGAG